MVVCPQCGQENPEGFRICGMCGSPLAEVAPEIEERKLVSVLFVDLVGHTAASDQADPEDVRARLRPYHQLLKREIERYGGTVEKFVGDAVMAVFGAPVAHEDDAERAVRSALRILEAVEELELEIRAAVATGEAVVSLAARPEQGEGIVAGDVVNTAARLQNEAPPGGLVVGEVTFRATRDVIEYEQLEPVSLKGKAEPVPLWRALRARGRFGVDAEAAPRTPFVGREHDLVLLQEAYARAVREQAVQLVTVVGEPGVGKTRLVAEFRSWLDDQPERIRWKQGRCLPYGEGITFWALGEIVKAQAGILESDSPDEAAEKLGTAVASSGVEDGSENEWLASRLAPLVGARTEAGSADQSESFTAWRRFLERLAAQRPLVLLFEDLHWADLALFDFLDELVEWGSEVPLLVVCTARPELYELNRGWGGGKRNSTTLSLSPLTTDETARLISALLERAVLPAETQAALLERAGGNPLYAEEFVRMLSDQGILTEHGELAGNGEIALPESVHALIAARLDTLAPEPKALLHDASVVGKVFWPGAVASIGGTERAAVRERLRELVRKELVRPARSSSVEGEEEFSFWHALVRDVAYGQIPRAARAEKHRAAAGWIEQTAGERASDHAELIAHHYEQALELARATGNDETAELEARAARFLNLAGERSFHLEPRRSYDYFCRALELAPEDGERAELLAAVARAARSVVDNAQVLRHWEEAVSAFRARGDPVEAAWALAQMSGIAWQLGETARSESLFAEALGLVEGHPASPKVADIYAREASQDALFGRMRECLESSRRALRIADQLGLEDVKLKALQFRGAARLSTGDAAGIDDLRVAVRRGLELGLTRDTDVAYANLGSWLWPTEGPAKALDNHLEGIEFAERRGLAGEAWKRAETVWFLFDLGMWDELLEVGRDPRPILNQMDVLVLAYKAHVLAYRGAVREAGELLGEAVVERAREIDDPQVLFAVLPIAALIAQLQGDLATALRLVQEYRDGQERRYFFEMLMTCVRVCIEARDWSLARELIDQEEETIFTRNRNSGVHARAMLAEGEGRFEEAEELYADAVAWWAEFGFLLEHGQALLGRGRCLVALGRADQAASDLREARKIFAGLGASSLVAEVDGLLPQAAVG